MEDHKSLLSRISTDKRIHEASLYSPLSEYNIFNILEVTSKEVIMCRFLADLLNPDGQHGCGILFLKSFLQNILNKSRVNDTLLTHTDVIREFVIDHDRRIDIVIQNSRFFIPIEVKIYAGEQEGQCCDYYEYAKAFDENAQVVYLTRFGNEPSKYSRKSKNGNSLISLDKIKCISWENDICQWLNKLLPHIKSPAQSTVIQYIDAIHSIANRKDIQNMEHTMEILYESADFFSAGIQIEKAMKAAKCKLIRLVFDDFKKEMNNIAPRYGLELENEAIYYSYEDRQHEKFYDCYSTYPGLNYIVKRAKFQNESLQLWFRIEVEHNLFAGFSLYDMSAEPRDGNRKGYQVNDITVELIEETAQYLNQDIIMPANWWFTWCYPNGKRQDNDYPDVPNFKEMNPCAIKLVDRKKRMDFVKSALRNFEEHLLKYLL